MLAIFLLIFTAFGWGISLQEAIDTALKKNPELRAMREELATFEGIEKSLSAFPNPKLTLETSRQGIFRLEMSQELPLWGALSKGRKVARNLRESFELRIEQREREITAEVYRAYMNVLFHKELLRIAEENLKAAREVYEFTERAYRLGEKTLLEVLRAKGEMDLVKTQVDRARASFSNSLKELSIVIGSEVLEVEGELMMTREPSSLDPEETPIVMSIEKEISSWRERTGLERRRILPSPRAGFILEDSEQNGYDLRGLISFDLPLFYRRQGEILEASSIKRSLEMRKEGEIFNISRRLESIRLRWEILRKTLLELEEKTIPNARREMELALKSYSNLSITLIELSDSRRRLYEILERRAEILMDLHSLYAEYISIGGWK